MKSQAISAIAIVSSLSFVIPSLAGSESDAKGGMESAKSVIPVIVAEPLCSPRQIQPLFTRYAQTTKKWTLHASYRSFKDVELQEVDQFDGSMVDAELIMPLSERWQLRLYYPFQTKGDASEVDTGDAVEIDGNGGTLDFPSLIADYQFKKADGPGDYNLAAYLGFGTVRHHLNAENKVTGGNDRINHRGSNVIFGLKADKQLSHCWTMIGNLGGRYYWDSDDIHPNDGSDQFFLWDVSAAFVYAPQNAWAYPVIELVYQGSISDYNSVQIVPQVVVPIGEHIDVNAGVSIGLVDDGPSTDARLQLTMRF